MVQRSKEAILEDIELPVPDEHMLKLLTLEVLCDIRDQLTKIANCSSRGQFITAEAI